MTESQWLTGALFDDELLRLMSLSTERKIQLFACGICRQLPHAMSDVRSRAAVDVAERWADHLVEEDQRQQAQVAAQEAWLQAGGVKGDRPSWLATILVAGEVPYNDCYPGRADYVLRGAEWAVAIQFYVTCNLHKREDCEQAIIRCVFGNPCRPVTADPTWRTTGVLDLARQMYDSRDFAPMPILADALQDAGCDHPEVLAHCRGAGPHVRGCWVVDLVLGKT